MASEIETSAKHGDGPMNGVVDISDDLADWANRAGYEVTQGSQPPLRDQVEDDGRAVIWANRGEIRYFIGGHASGWFYVNSSERMSEEVLVFAAESMQLIELYFYGKFGLSLRSSQTAYVELSAVG